VNRKEQNFPPKKPLTKNSSTKKREKTPSNTHSHLQNASQEASAGAYGIKEGKTTMLNIKAE